MNIHVRVHNTKNGVSSSRFIIETKRTRNMYLQQSQIIASFVAKFEFLHLGNHLFYSFDDDQACTKTGRCSRPVSTILSVPCFVNFLLKFETIPIANRKFSLFWQFQFFMLSTKLTQPSSNATFSDPKYDKYLKIYAWQSAIFYEKILSIHGFSVLIQAYNYNLNYSHSFHLLCFVLHASICSHLGLLEAVPNDCKC